MAKKGRKLTPLQAEFKKQQKRIQNFIRRGEKKGYKFQPNLVPEMPKRVTRKALENIKSIQAPYLYNRATYTYPEMKIGGKVESPETVPARQHRKIQRVLAGEKGKVTRLAHELQSRFSLDYEDARKQARELIFKVNTETNYIDRYKPVSPYETIDDRIDRLNREIEEAKAERDSEEKPVNPFDLNDPRNTTDFYKELEDRINENGKGARDKYYNNNKEYVKNTGEPPSASESILLQIENMIDTWHGDTSWTSYWYNVKAEDRNQLKQMLHGAILLEGRENVARRMEENADEVIRLATYILYSSDDREQIDMAFVDFSRIIVGRTLTFEENSYMTEMAEAMQKYN